MRFAAPRTNSSTATFGLPSNRVNQIFGTGGPRAFQFAARINFLDQVSVPPLVRRKEVAEGDDCIESSPSATFFRLKAVPTYLVLKQRSDS